MRQFALAYAVIAALALSPQLDARPAKPVKGLSADEPQRSSYIISFDEPAGPRFAGFLEKRSGRPDLAPVSIKVTGEAQYDAGAPAAAAYLSYIGQRREQRLLAGSARVGRTLQPRFVYEHALNGVALELSAEEARLLETVPGVRAVTPDFERFRHSDPTPDFLRAPQVWNGSAGVTSRGEGVVVGVIDSGINPAHPSFAAAASDGYSFPARSAFLGVCATAAANAPCNNKLIGVYDFVSGGSAGTAANVNDPDGHGSHVASTAVGNPVSSSFQGVPVTLSGVAPRALLVAYRGCASTTGTRSCGPNSGSQLLAAINRAIADGVDVINYSLGGDAIDPWLTVGGAINSDEEAFLAAREAGIVVVTSAGNDGPQPGSLGSPGNAPWVVAVGAVTNARVGPGDELASFSARGPIVPLGVVKPDVTAPGVNIRAAARDGSGVASLTGTSMASPAVAGAAALLMAARPSWNADQVVSALMLTARAGSIVPQGSAGAGTTPHDRGAGTIDVSRAVNAPLSLNVPAGSFASAGAAGAFALNLPSIAFENCVETCATTRTVSTMPGGGAGQFDVISSLPAGVSLAATPGRVSVSAGGSAQIQLRFSAAAQVPLNRWAYGSVTLRRVGGGAPDLTLPVAIYFSSGTVPSLVQRTVSAERGFVDIALDGIVGLPNARFAATAFATPRTRTATIAQDSARDDVYDNPADGAFFDVLSVNFSDGASRNIEIIATLAPSSTPAARDLDLFVGVDDDSDGAPDKIEERCEGVTPGNVESCTFQIVHPGNGVPIVVWAIAQNYQASAAGASNGARLELVGIDPARSTTQQATGPGNVLGNSPFSVRLVYDEPGFLNGESRMGFVFVDRGPNANAIRVPFRLTRTGTDSAPFALSSGAVRSVTLPAGAAQDRLFIDVPAGTTQLAVTTTSPANVDLFLASVGPTAASADIPAIAPAPARGNAAVSATTPSGNEALQVSNPAPGRWYITPVNASGAVASMTVRATVTGTAPSIRPSGYFNPQRSGHGLFLFPAGAELFGLWYTYEENGNPTWYVLQGPAPGANGFFSGTLFRSAWNGSANSLTSVGSATVSPRAVNEFTFSYNVDGQTGSERFEKFGGGCPNLGSQGLNVSSHWFNPVRSGTGYSVQMFSTYEFMAAFVYDGLGQPRFLVSERSAAGGVTSATASTPLEQLTGFCPLCARSDAPSRASIGSFSRSFANGTFSNITLSGNFINGVPGSWAGSESVSALGGFAGLQGCAP